MRAQMLALRAALDYVPLGIVLLDAQLRAQLINRAFRRMWLLPDQVADSRPSFVTLMHHGRDTLAYEVTKPELEAQWRSACVTCRREIYRLLDLRRSGGDVVRMQCTPLPGRGRMLTYTPVTDIVRYSDELKLLRDALEYRRGRHSAARSRSQFQLHEPPDAQLLEVTEQEAEARRPELARRW